MNEKEYKEAARLGLVAENSGAMCSVTGRPCKCVNSGRCRAHRSSVDNLPNELVRRLKTLYLHIDIARDDTFDIEGYDEGSRQWPQPEIRDVRRKLDSIQRTLEEILER